MELNDHPRAENGGRRVPPVPTEHRKGLSEVREQLARAQENSTSELNAARQRVARVKAEAADRARRMSAAAQPDRIDLSSTARVLLEDVSGPDAQRANLVAELKAAYEAGTVNTRERIELAASRLLGGE